LEDAKGKGGTETLREDGTPGPGGEETDEVALRRRKGEKGGWMAKEAAKDADKGWWFVIMQVKIFRFARSEPVRGKNASHDHQTAWGPFRGQEWSLSLIE
jgi:hypothetical protein